jgi:hypothetical protein
MSTIEEAAISRLTTDAGVAAITTKHHAELAPQGSVAPYTVYQVISAPELEVAEYVRPRLQVACWAATYGGAVALANAVRACFYNQHLSVLGVHFRSWIANVMDGEPDLETGRFCRIVDVRFDYRNPT